MKGYSPMEGRDHPRSEYVLLDIEIDGVTIVEKAHVSPI